MYIGCIGDIVNHFMQNIHSNLFFSYEIEFLGNEQPYKTCKRIELLVKGSCDSLEKKQKLDKAMRPNYSKPSRWCTTITVIVINVDYQR